MVAIATSSAEASFFVQRRVTGDEAQGKMGRRKKRGQPPVFSFPRSFARERETSGYEAVAIACFVGFTFLPAKTCVLLRLSSPVLPEKSG